MDDKEYLNHTIHESKVHVPSDGRCNFTTFSSSSFGGCRPRLYRLNDCMWDGWLASQTKYGHRSRSRHDHDVINGDGERMHHEQEKDRSTCRLTVRKAQSVVRAPRMDDQECPRYASEELVPSGGRCRYPTFSLCSFGWRRPRPCWRDAIGK